MPSIKLKKFKNPFKSKKILPITAGEFDDFIPIEEEREFIEGELGVEEDVELKDETILSNADLIKKFKKKKRRIIRLISKTRDIEKKRRLALTADILQQEINSLKLY